MVKNPQFEAIEYLVRRKYPIANVRAASSMNVGTPGAPSHEEITWRAQAIENFRKELSSKTPAEIAELVKAENEKEHAETAARLAREEEQRFYNQPSARADFDHYCKAAYWTLDECVALSFGKDPKRVNWNTVQPYIHTSPFVKAYEKLRDLTSRANWARQLFDPVKPSIYLAWAKEQKIALSDELVSRAVNSGLSLKNWRDLFKKQKAHLEALRQKHDMVVEELRRARSEIEALRQHQPANQANSHTSDSDKPLGTKERDSLLKLVGGMAVRGYSFDPRQSRNDATSEIRKDLQVLGLGMDDDTIRKYLNQGGELIPRDVLENVKRKPNSAKR